MLGSESCGHAWRISRGDRLARDRGGAREPAQLPAIEVTLGRAHRRRGDLAAAANHLEAALGSPDLARTLRVRALVERSVVALRAGDLEVAASVAREAGATAATEDPHGAGLAERLLGLVALRAAICPRRGPHSNGARNSRPTTQTRPPASPRRRPSPWPSPPMVPSTFVTAMEAVGACRRIGDRHLEAAVENHLADLLHDAGRDADAMDHLKRAVALFAEVGEGEPERDPGIWALAAR